MRISDQSAQLWPPATLLFNCSSQPPVSSRLPVLPHSQLCVPYQQFLFSDLWPCCGCCLTCLALLSFRQARSPLDTAVFKAFTLHDDHWVSPAKVYKLYPTDLPTNNSLQTVPLRLAYLVNKSHSRNSTIVVVYQLYSTTRLKQFKIVLCLKDSRTRSAKCVAATAYSSNVGLCSTLGLVHKNTM